MIDIATEFTTSTRKIAEFYEQAGLGFYIPLYQREYSWDKNNIDQLMDDICSGVECLLEHDNEIRFMGTIIRVKETTPEKNVTPRDVRAIPTRIDNIIDGQQRISTISLLATLLYQHLDTFAKNLPQHPPYSELVEDINGKLITLQEIFSLDLRRGKPKRKPMIIRGSIDQWTLDGLDEENYKSPVSAYLATIIRTIDEKSSSYPPIPNNQNQVVSNLKTMKDWLRKVEKAHLPESDRIFPPANEIIEKIDEKYIWAFKRDELKTIINDPKNPNYTYLCSIVQLLAFIHYLLDRCCFTVIDPTREEWAFDMFQSLNATGTPLTVIETFKPLVVNLANQNHPTKHLYKGSSLEKYFNCIDKFLSNQKTADAKNKLTDDYLSTFQLIYNGSKPERQFSRQRRWLTDIYTKLEDQVAQTEFIHQMGNVATYLDNRNSIGEPDGVLPHLDSLKRTEQELVTMCLLYLRESNHKMADTLLSRFYAYVLRKEPESVQNFADATKAITAFYTLWRSALSNSGLDNVYRHILKGTGSDIRSLAWTGNQIDFTVSNLKRYLKQALQERDVYDPIKWKSRASQKLAYYQARTVCRFALLVTSYNTIPDPDKPGLIKIARDGTTTECYLTANGWRGPSFKTIEHIAPKKPEGDWDSALYESEEYDLIGNLTLLPAKVNTSAGNKSWKAKWIYYSHLAQKDTEKLKHLIALANSHGIELSEQTIELLKGTSYNAHIAPLVELGVNGDWDVELVKDRTDRICDIVWIKMNTWLSSIPSPI